jgi:hypothetical protein
MDQRSSTLARDHEHAPGPPSLHASLLRLSVPERLGIGAGLALLLWAAVLWALA